jgi:hypothetical protein
MTNGGGGGALQLSERKSLLLYFLRCISFYLSVKDPLAMHIYI